MTATLKTQNLTNHSVFEGSLIKCSKTSTILATFRAPWPRIDSEIIYFSTKNYDGGHMSLLEDLSAGTCSLNKPMVNYVYIIVQLCTAAAFMNLRLSYSIV